MQFSSYFTFQDWGDLFNETKVCSNICSLSLLLALKFQIVCILSLTFPNNEKKLGRSQVDHQQLMDTAFNKLGSLSSRTIVSAQTCSCSSLLRTPTSQTLSSPHIRRFKDTAPSSCTHASKKPHCRRSYERRRKSKLKRKNEHLQGHLRNN